MFVSDAAAGTVQAHWFIEPRQFPENNLPKESVAFAVQGVRSRVASRQLVGIEKSVPAASILALATVHLLRVHTGVHQTFDWLAGNLGFEPPTTRPTFAFMAASALLYAVLGSAKPRNLFERLCAVPRRARPAAPDPEPSLAVAISKTQSGRRFCCRPRRSA